MILWGVPPSARLTGAILYPSVSHLLNIQAQMFGPLSNIPIRLSPIKHSEFITNILKIGHSQKFGTPAKMSII